MSETELFLWYRGRFQFLSIADNFVVEWSLRRERGILFAGKIDTRLFSPASKLRRRDTHILCKLEFKRRLRVKSARGLLSLFPPPPLTRTRGFRNSFVPVRNVLISPRETKKCHFIPRPINSVM